MTEHVCPGTAPVGSTPSSPVMTVRRRTAAAAAGRLSELRVTETTRQRTAGPRAGDGGQCGDRRPCGDPAVLSDRDSRQGQCCCWVGTSDVIFRKMADRYRQKPKFGRNFRPNTDREHPKPKFDRNCICYYFTPKFKFFVKVVMEKMGTVLLT